MTAFEVAERQAMIAKDKGAGYGRLTNEISIPMVERTVEILQDQGHLPREFRIDGKVIQVRSISPLARAQQFDQIQQNQAFLQSCAGAASLDPAAMALPNVTALLRQEALYRGIDTESLNTEQEIRGALEQIGQSRALAAQTGNEDLDTTPDPTGMQLINGGRS